MAMAALLMAGILVWNLDNLIFSIRLASSMQKIASGATGRDLPVIETKVHRHMGARGVDALIYRPAKSQATSAIIIAAGISELGCYHPRLVAFSRFLADRGLLVITPDIQEFREFRISAEPIGQMLFWCNNTKSLEGGEEIKKIGLAGISFSATLAFMAAARPEAHDKVAFVAGIGPYYSLIRCTREWFAAGSPAAANSYYPTRFYAKWIVMLSALDMLEAPADRLFLQSVLEDLLLQKRVPPAGSDLTRQGLRWYRLATMPEGKEDMELSQKIEEYLVARIYPQLDPKEALDALRSPIFLIHGAYDDLIPPRESIEIHRRINHSYLLLTPFLTHTHPTDTALSLKQKARALLDTLIFCFQFARAIR